MVSAGNNVSPVLVIWNDQNKFLHLPFFKQTNMKILKVRLH